MKKYLESIKKHFSASKTAAVILGIGIVLRFLRYFSNPVVWSDDVTRLFEVQKYSYLQLFQLGSKYVTGVHDPYGFLAVQKLIISLLGTSPYVFRLLPFLSSLLSLWLFNKIKDWFVSPKGGLVALGLFAICPPIINYTAIFNTYPSDVCLVLLMYIIFRRLENEGFKPRGVLLFSLAGALCIWFSLQSIFILAGGILALVLAQSVRKNLKKALMLLAMSGFWTANFTFYYFQSLQYHMKQPHLVRCWKDYVLPQGQGAYLTLIWFLKKFYEMFANPAALVPALALGLFVIGCCVLIRNKKRQVLILLIPLALTALAAVLRKYAFGDRALVFLMPSLYLLTGEGWSYLYAGERRHYRPVIAFTILMVLLYMPLVKTKGIIKQSFQRGSIPDVLRYITARYQDGDIVYVFYNARQTFLYYKDSIDLRGKDYRLGSLCGTEMKCRGDIDTLKDYERVWFLFFMTGDTEEIKFWRNTLGQWGKRSDVFRLPWAGVYLYERKSEDS